MEQKKSSENKWIGVGLLAAVAAALCCITPVLAVLGGLGGIASTFSFLDPLRPYLIGFTAVVLGYAFYNAYKPKNECDVNVHANLPVKQAGTKKVLQRKTFLTPEHSCGL